MSALLNSQDSSATVDLEALETAVKSSMMDLGAALLSSWINADRGDGATGELDCECGSRAVRSGRRNKLLVSALGLLRLRRTYYHCDGCGRGFFPKDRQLGIQGRSVSPAVRRMIGRTAAEVSFAGTQTLLRLLALVGVSVKQVERVAENLGREIAAHERTSIEPEPCDARTMYLGMDGTGVPVIKSESEGRKGKQADGSAKTREMKLVTVWTAEKTNKEGRLQTDPGSVSYNAAIETASTKDADLELAPFAQRVYREALRRGFYEAERQVVVADGATWIWSVCSELFPDAIQIVDIFHAREKVHDVSKALYGGSSDLAEQWANLRCEELDRGNIEALITGLKGVSGHCKLAAQAVGYFDNNRERMRYASFREQRLVCSSGVLEAGCKDAIGARQKRSGMRWSVDGANAIAALRCSVKSDRFDDFWYETALG